MEGEDPPEITYPESTDYGINILDRDTTYTTYKSGISYSVAAVIPPGARIRIRLNFWGCSDYTCFEFGTSPEGWGDFYTLNCDDLVDDCDSRGELLNFRRNWRIFKSDSLVFANDPFTFIGTEREGYQLMVFENGSDVPQFTKYLHWTP